jgi:hypothetical protein
MPTRRFAQFGERLGRPRTGPCTRDSKGPRTPTGSVRWAALSALAVLVPLLAMLALWGVLAGLSGATRIVAAVTGLDEHPVAALLVVLAGLAVAAAITVRVFRRRRLPRIPAVPESTPASRAHIPSSSTWVRVAAWVATIVGVWWVVFVPLWGRLSTAWYGPGDANQYIWFGWRFGQALRDGEVVPTVFADVVVPAGLDVLTLDGALPLYVLGLLNLPLGPVAAYNLLLLGIAALNVWAGYRLAAMVTAHLAVCLAAGAALATAPSLIWRYSGHLGISCLFAAALLFAEGLLMVRDGRAPTPWRLGLLLSVAALVSVYQLVLGGLGLAVCLVFAVRRDRAADMVWRLGAALAGAAVVLLPFLLVRLAFERAEVAAGRGDLFDGWMVFYRSAFVNDVIGLLPPSNLLVAERLPALLTPEYLRHEGFLYPGLAALLALGALVALCSPYRWPILTFAAFSWILGLGTVPHVRGGPLRLLGQSVEWGPMTPLYLLPGTDGMRIPGRLALGVALAAVGALAVLGHHVWQTVSRPAHRAVLVAGFAFTLVLNRVDTNVVSDFVDRPTREALGRLSTQGDGAMLVVPADCDGIEVEYLLLQVYAQVPMAGCTAPHLAVPWFSELDPYASSRGMAALRCRPTDLGPFRATNWPADTALGPADVADLRDELGIRWLILDHGTLAAPRCDTVRGQSVPVLGALARTMPGERWEIVDLGPVDT